MKNKNFPLISIGFSLTSKFADLDKISRDLKLTPTKIRKKEEWPVTSIKAGLASDFWEITTELTTSISVDEECKKLINILKGKEEIIKFLCKEYTMEGHFEVVIHMKSNNTPAIYLEKETILFLSNIGADIGFDVYAYDEEYTN